MYQLFGGEQQPGFSVLQQAMVSEGLLGFDLLSPLHFVQMIPSLHRRKTRRHSRERASNRLPVSPFWLPTLCPTCFRPQLHPCEA